MEIKKLTKRSILEGSKRKTDGFTYFQNVIDELNTRNLPNKTIVFINKGVEELNTWEDTDKSWYRQLLKVRLRIMRYLEKEHKLVRKGHHQTQWMALGMGMIGMPIGLLFGLFMGNLAFLGVGLPLGMTIGMGIGASYDKKAADEGRQLNAKPTY